MCVCVCRVGGELQIFLYALFVYVLLIFYNSVKLYSFVITHQGRVASKLVRTCGPTLLLFD